MFQYVEENFRMVVEVEKKLNIQAIVTVVSCIFIEVITDVEASIVVWSILEINQV